MVKEQQQPVSDFYDTRGVPIDIWDNILDLIDDIPTWKACALTCRALLRRSRYHLFRRIHIKNPHDAQFLVCTLRKDHASRSAIRELQLDFLATAGPIGRGLFPMLSNLRALHIYSASSDVLSPRLCTKLEPIGETVTSLMLEGCALALDDLAPLLAALPNVRDLVLSRVAFRGSAHDSLATEQWNATCIPRQCLPNGLMPCTVRQLYFQPRYQVNPAIANKYMDIFAHSMHTLALSLSGLSRGLSLQGVLSLRYLHLEFDISMVEVCIDILRSLPPEILVGLSLAVRSSQPWRRVAPETIPWERISALSSLDGVLSHPHFSSLRRLSARCTMIQSQWSMALSPLQCCGHIMTVLLPSLNPEVWDDTLEDVFRFGPAIRE